MDSEDVLGGGGGGWGGGEHAPDPPPPPTNNDLPIKMLCVIKSLPSGEKNPMLHPKRNPNSTLFSFQFSINHSRERKICQSTFCTARLKHISMVKVWLGNSIFCVLINWFVWSMRYLKIGKVEKIGKSWLFSSLAINHHFNPNVTFLKKCQKFEKKPQLCHIKEIFHNMN